MTRKEEILLRLEELNDEKYKLEDELKQIKIANIKQKLSELNPTQYSYLELYEYNDDYDDIFTFYVVSDLDRDVFRKFFKNEDDVILKDKLYIDVYYERLM